MTPLLAGIVSSLIQNNLPKVAQAVMDKGLDYVQEKTGIKLKPDMNPEEVKALREAAQKHEEFRCHSQFLPISNQLVLKSMG